MSKRNATRREFVKSAALLAAGPLAAGSTAAAGQPAEPPRPRDPITAAGQALTDVIRARYGQHLTDEQLRRVQRRLESNLRTADRLRRIPLQNGDEPAFAFDADVP